MAGSRLSKALLDEGFYRYVKNPKRGRCPVFGCTNNSKPDRSLCSRHHTLRFARQHPDKSYYANLKRHAKARGKVFTITFEEFMAVAKDFDWEQYKLEHGKRMSIDRIDVTRGYEAGNIQAMTVSENVVKQHRMDYSPEGLYWQGKAEERQALDAVPF